MHLAPKFMLSVLFVLFAASIQALVITSPIAGSAQTSLSSLVVTLDSQGMTLANIQVSLNGQFLCAIASMTPGVPASCTGTIPCGLGATPQVMAVGTVSGSAVLVNAAPVPLSMTESGLCLPAVIVNPPLTSNALEPLTIEMQYNFNTQYVNVTINGYYLCTMEQTTAGINASCTGNVPCAAVGTGNEIQLSGLLADGTPLSQDPIPQISIIGDLACLPRLTICGCPQVNAVPREFVRFAFTLHPSDDLSKYSNFTLYASNTLFEASQVIWESTVALNSTSALLECANSWLLKIYEIPCSLNEIGETEFTLTFIMGQGSSTPEPGVSSLTLNILDNTACQLRIHPRVLGRMCGLNVDLIAAASSNSSDALAQAAAQAELQKAMRIQNWVDAEEGDDLLVDPEALEAEPEALYREYVAFEAANAPFGNLGDEAYSDGTIRRNIAVDGSSLGGSQALANESYPVASFGAAPVSQSTLAARAQLALEPDVQSSIPTYPPEKRPERVAAAVKAEVLHKLLDAAPAVSHAFALEFRDWLLIIRRAIREAPKESSNLLQALFVAFQAEPKLTFALLKIAADLVDGMQLHGNLPIHKAIERLIERAQQGKLPLAVLAALYKAAPAETKALLHAMAAFALKVPFCFVELLQVTPRIFVAFALLKRAAPAELADALTNYHTIACLFAKAAKEGELRKALFALHHASKRHVKAFVFYVAKVVKCDAEWYNLIEHAGRIFFAAPAAFMDLLRESPFLLEAILNFPANINATERLDAKRAAKALALYAFANGALSVQQAAALLLAKEALGEDLTASKVASIMGYTNATLTAPQAVAIAQFLGQQQQQPAFFNVAPFSAFRTGFAVGDEEALQRFVSSPLGIAPLAVAQSWMQALPLPAWMQSALLNGQAAQVPLIDAAFAAANAVPVVSAVSAARAGVPLVEADPSGFGTLPFNAANYAAAASALGDNGIVRLVDPALAAQLGLPVVEAAAVAQFGVPVIYGAAQAAQAVRIGAPAALQIEAMIGAIGAEPESDTARMMALASALMLAEPQMGVAEVAALAEIFGIGADNVETLSQLLQASWGVVSASASELESGFGVPSLDSLRPYDNIAYIISQGGALNVYYTNLSLTLVADCNELLIWQQADSFSTTSCTHLKLAAVQELPAIFNGQGTIDVVLKYTVNYADGSTSEKESVSVMYVGFSPRFGFKCCRPNEMNCRVGCGTGRRRSSYKCKPKRNICAEKKRPCNC